MASLQPNVMGSAWIPCVRPTIGVSLNSNARFFKTWPSRRHCALKPLLEFVLVAPDAAHFRAGVTRDHSPLPDTKNKCPESALTRDAEFETGNYLFYLAFRFPSADFYVGG